MMRVGSEVELVGGPMALVVGFPEDRIVATARSRSGSSVSRRFPTVDAAQRWAELMKEPTDISVEVVLRVPVENVPGASGSDEAAKLRHGEWEL